MNIKRLFGLILLLGLAQVAVAQDKIIVSGASGQLGGLVIEALLKRKVAPANLILVSRTPDTLKAYADRGASVRFGDFTQPESLAVAYRGGNRMLLISINGGGGERPEQTQRYTVDLTAHPIDLRDIQPPLIMPPVSDVAAVNRPTFIGPYQFNTWIEGRRR